MNHRNSRIVEYMTIRLAKIGSCRVEDRFGYLCKPDVLKAAVGKGAHGHASSTTDDERILAVRSGECGQVTESELCAHFLLVVALKLSIRPQHVIAMRIGCDRYKAAFGVLTEIE